MTLQELLGKDYKDDMTIDDINNAIAKREFVDSSTIAPSVDKSLYDKIASQLAEAKRELKATQQSTMTDNEKLQLALKEAEATKEEYERKTVRLEVEKHFIQNGLSDDDYSPFIEDIVTSDASKSIALTDNIIKLIKAQSEKATQEYKNNLREKLPKMPKGKGDEQLTEEEFKKMTLTEKMKLKAENPEQYKILNGGN